MSNEQTMTEILWILKSQFLLFFLFVCSPILAYSIPSSPPFLGMYPRKVACVVCASSSWSYGMFNIHSLIPSTKSRRPSLPHFVYPIPRVSLHSSFSRPLYKDLVPYPLFPYTGISSHPTSPCQSYLVILSSWELSRLAHGLI